MLRQQFSSNQDPFFGTAVLHPDPRNEDEFNRSLISSATNRRIDIAAMHGHDSWMPADPR